MKDTSKVNVDNLFPLFGGHFQKRCIPSDPCIIYENINLSKTFYDEGSSIRCRFKISHIDFDKKSSASSFFKFSNSQISFCFKHIPNDYFGTFIGKFSSCFITNALCTSSDDRYFIL